MEPLLECARDTSRETPAVRGVALRALSRIRDPRAVGPLLEALIVGESWLPPVIAPVLVRIGEPAVQEVAALLENRDRPVAARRWAAQGWSVLAIDLAEHGERADRTPDDVMERRRLVGQPAFIEQSVADLKRGVDLLAATPEVDPARVGFTGFSLGGMLGTVFAAQEPRVAAVAIVIAGSFAHLRYWDRGDTAEERRRRRAAADATDPAFFAAAIAPRPFLMVNTRDDPIFPEAAVMSLFEAAGEPKELRWHPGTHHEWGGGLYRDVWTFLSKHFMD